MAAIEVEEIIEGVEEAIEGAEEGIEEIPEAEQAAAEAAVAEAQEAIDEFSNLRSALNTLWDIALPNMKSMMKFLVKNAAIGAVLYGVSVGLNKLFKKPSEGQSKDVKRKRSFLKTLTTVIDTERLFGKKILDWFKDHQDDQITIGGYEVPLESILTKYIDPIEDASNNAVSVAKSLQEKVDGKSQIRMPTAGDMQLFLEAADKILQAFSCLIEFIADKKHTFKDLKSFPLGKTDISLLTNQVNRVKAQPAKQINGKQITFPVF